MRLIDADALIEALGLDQYNNAEGMTSEEEWVAEAIMTAPTIEAEPVRRGTWVKRGGQWTCTECGIEDYYAYAWNSETREDTMQDLYCPNCGAKME